MSQTSECAGRCSDGEFLFVCCGCSNRSCGGTITGACASGSSTTSTTSTTSGISRSSACSSLSTSNRHHHDQRRCRYHRHDAHMTSIITDHGSASGPRATICSLKLPSGGLVRQRDGTAIRNRQMIVALGSSTDGLKTVLDFCEGGTENAPVSIPAISGRSDHNWGSGHLLFGHWHSYGHSCRFLSKILEQLTIELYVRLAPGEIAVNSISWFRFLS